MAEILGAGDVYAFESFIAAGLKLAEAQLVIGRLDECERTLQSIVVASPQLAPLKVCVSPIGTTAPPSTEVLFSLCPTRNPTHCPSGEKKGL